MSPMRRWTVTLACLLLGAWWVVRVVSGAIPRGTDDLARQEVLRVAPDFRPGGALPWSLGSSEVESGMFLLQAAGGLLLLVWSAHRLRTPT